jgi:hypothetical protein
VRFGRIGINLRLCPQPRAFGPDRRPTTPPTGGRDHSLAGAGLECFSSGDEGFHERHLLYSPHYRIRRGSGLSHVRGPRRRVIPQRLAAAARGSRPPVTALLSAPPPSVPARPRPHGQIDCTAREPYWSRGSTTNTRCGECSARPWSETRRAKCSQRRRSAISAEPKGLGSTCGRIGRRSRARLTTGAGGRVMPTGNG